MSPESAVVPYPPEIAEGYRKAGVWGSRTLAQELHASAVAHPDREAVVDLHDRLSYAELDAHSDLVANGLLDLGLAPGDPVLLQITNTTWAVVAWWALLKAGLLPICTLAIHRQHEVGQIAAQTQPRAHLVQADLKKFDLVAFAETTAAECPSLEYVLTLGAEAGRPGVRLEQLAVGDPAAARAAVDRVQERLRDDDVAVLQLSGGTTSVPKVIPRLHAEYWYNARAYAEALGWDAEVRVAHLIPVVHNAGVVCALHSAASVGAACVVGTSEPTQFPGLVARERCTDVMVGLPHVHAILSESAVRGALDGVKRLIFSGSALPLSLGERLDASGLHVVQLFGMGEGLFLLTRPTASLELRLRTVGTALSPLDEVRVFRPGTEDEADPGEDGELCCRGPYTIHGYYAAPEHDRFAFSPSGFYRTGDVARRQRIDGEDCFSMEGRLKDVISRGAEKINAAEVEELLLLHSGIAHVAVVAMPDERFGERACAFLVAADGSPALTLADIQEHLDAKGLSQYKWPERLEWVDGLPRTAVTKINKKALREQIAARLHDEARAPVAS